MKQTQREAENHVSHVSKERQIDRDIDREVDIYSFIFPNPCPVGSLLFS